MHDLTTKINDSVEWVLSIETYKKVDEAIISWLSKKADELTRPVFTTKGIAMGYLKGGVRKILGLEISNEEIVQKLDSMKNEKTVTVGSSEGAREHLNRLMTKEPEMGREWCEHVKPQGVFLTEPKIHEMQFRQKEDGVYRSKLYVFNDNYDWKFCPICAAPRPHKKNELWQVLKDLNGQGANCRESLDEYFKRLAQGSISYFLEIVDSLPVMSDSHYPDPMISKSALLARMEEVL